jgi:DNA-directed RNA polymerase subunit RPC12/RpoP
LQVGGKYVCSICGKQFLQRLRYTTHVDRHANVRRHICTTCGKAFTYKYSLWSHAKKCIRTAGAPVEIVAAAAAAPLNAMSTARFSNSLETAGDAEFVNSAAVRVDFTGLSNDSRQVMSSDENGHSAVTGGCANKLSSV